MDLSFTITSEQEKTINIRAKENGFNYIEDYLRVVSLKTEDFKREPSGLSHNGDIELSFSVTEEQKEKILANCEESYCEDLNSYLQFMALNGVVSTVVEVRSTGSLNDMLARIAASKKN